MNWRTTACLLLAISSVPALEAQNTPIIRAETREVLIDATVTGKKPGTDLTAKDFSIWEDGKAQKINSVSLAGADPETSLKHFVIYYDFSMMRMDDQAASERAASAFVEGLASADRYMAVVTYGTLGARVLQDFTAAKSVLLKAVGAPVNPRPVVGVPGNSAQMVELAGSLSAVCTSMAPAPGRKVLLFFTAAYGANSDPFKGVLSACNRANVAITVIASNASSDFSVDRGRPQPKMPGVLQTLDTQPSGAFAQFLAEGSGGQALSFSEKLGGQLAAVARDQDEYYRLAYTPPPAKEGSCHALRVAGNVRGLGIQARNEYCTEKVVDLVAGKIAGQSLEARGAGAGNLGATMQLPYFYTGANRASVHLSVDIVPAGMKFDKDKSGLHGQIDVVGTAVRADGGTAARFADTVNIDLPDQQRADAFTHATWHYEHQFTVAAGSYAFQMAIGAGPDVVGRLEAPLTIAPWNSASFGISGIALSTETHALDSLPAAGGPMLEGRGPLVAGGKQFVPAATNRFGRLQQVYFYTEIYDPAIAGANQAGLTMQYRILDRATGAVRMDSGTGSIGGYVRPENPVVPFATRLTVGDLAPGLYRLEVRAANSSGPNEATRTIDFELH